MKTSEALRKVLDILDHGNAWVKHHSITVLPSGAHAYCISGACHFVQGFREAMTALAPFVPDSVPLRVAATPQLRVIVFNDSPYTTWNDIETLFLNAIHAAEEQEAREAAAEQPVPELELELVG